MTWKDYVKKTFKLAIPICLGQMGMMIFGLVDNIMIGRLGATHLAAGTFGHAIVMFPMFFTFGLATATGIVVSQSKGAEDEQGTRDALRNALLINLSAGLVLFSIVLVLAKFSHLFGQEAIVAELAKPYMIIVGLSMIPVVINQTFRQYSEALGYSGTPMVVMLIGHFMNFVLNYTLIFGNFGAPRLELEGAAWGTLLSRVLMSICLITVVLKFKKYDPYRPVVWFSNYSKRLLKKLLYIGVPGGLQSIFELGAFAGVAIMMGWIGVPEQAAHQVALQYASFTFMGAFGYAMATSLRVGEFFGKRNMQAVRDIIHGSVIIVTLWSILCATVFVVFRDQLPYLFISDKVVVSIAAQLLLIAGIFQLADALQAVMVLSLRGCNDVKFPTLVTFIFYYVISLPLGYFLGFHTELKYIGLWIGITTGLVGVAVVLGVRMLKITSIKK